MGLWSHAACLVWGAAMALWLSVLFHPAPESDLLTRVDACPAYSQLHP